MRGLIWKRLLGFTTLGACVLLVSLYWRPGASTPAESETINITAGQLQLAEANWRARWGRPPGVRDREIILRNETNEEVLFREALRAGLHHTDPVVKRRLWQNMKFLEVEQSEQSGVEILKRAYELDMHRTDIVVRRRLVQRFHRNLLDVANPPAPTHEELVAFINADPASFQSIPRLSFVQLYVDSDAEGEPPERARELLRQVRDSSDPDAVLTLGDPLPLQRQFSDATPVDLAKRFGQDFTDALSKAPSGTWSGPYQSALGWHVVWLRDYQPAQVIVDEMTLAKAREQLLMHRKETMVRNALDTLRQRYQIIVSLPERGDEQQEG